MVEPSILRAPVHYVHAADGTRLAYRERGQGPAVVLANGLSTSEFFWRLLVPRWARGHRVITWDYKGHGRSEPARSDAGCTIPATLDDMRRVMDAAQVERAVLVGFSMGCQVVTEAWRRIPERVVGLAYLLGPAGRIFDTALRPLAGPALRQMLRMPGPWLSPVFGAVHRLAGLPGSMHMGRWLRLYGRATDADLQRYVDHFGRLDPHTLARLALAAGEHDARDVLPTITVPTLVVAGDRDVFAPSERVGVPMHAAIPGARLVRIDDGTHLGIVEHHEPIGRAVDELLGDAWGR